MKLPRLLNQIEHIVERIFSKWWETRYPIWCTGCAYYCSVWLTRCIVIRAVKRLVKRKEANRFHQHVRRYNGIYKFHNGVSGHVMRILKGKRPREDQCHRKTLSLHPILKYFGNNCTMWNDTTSKFGNSSICYFLPLAKLLLHWVKCIFGKGSFGISSGNRMANTVRRFTSSDGCDGSFADCNRC